MDPWSRGGWSQNAWIVASVLKKKSYSVLVFSIIICFSVDNSYNRIDPSDQVKQEKENTGNETRLVCSYKKNAGLPPNPPCHANIIQVCVVRETNKAKK